MKLADNAIMDAPDDAIVAQAIDWHLRQPVLTAEEWIRLVDWLEANPAGARVFDRLAAVDRLLPDVAALATPAALPVAANDDFPPRRRWLWTIGGGAIAAGIAALLAPLALTGQHADAYEVATRPGEQRAVALADGTRIELSGGTRISLDRANPRVATLVAGEAVFHVRHDAASPFTLHSGALSIRDLGTVFDVVRAGPRLEVQVAEGSVMFQPDREAIVLTPGHGLTVREDVGRITLANVAPDTVGGWRTGRIAFTNTPVADVFAAVERRYGTAVRLDGDLPGRPFTGMVRLTGAADQDIPHLATLIGARWRRNGDIWILAPVGGDQP